MGIGSDFDGIVRFPRVGGCFEDAEPHRRPAKTRFSEADIQKIMGGNFLRVIREVVGQ